MDWAVEFLADDIKADVKENVRLIRDTLEAKLKADSGQHSEAARILWELLVQLRRAKNRRAENITLVHMGKVYRVLRLSIAVQLFEEALELADAIHFDRARMMALVELGELDCLRDQFTEALERFGRALALVLSGDQECQRVVLLDMVIAHEGLDELERARELLQEVIAIDRRIGSDNVDEHLAQLSRIDAAIGRRPAKEPGR